MTNAYILSQIFISLCLLMVIVRMFARLRRERFRSKIRKLRDDLFDWMVAHGQDFNSSEYRDVRQTLNGMMRMSNTIGPVEFLVLFARERGKRHAPQAGDVQSMSESPLKQKLIQVQIAAVQSTLLFLYAEGIFGKCFMAVWRCCKMVSGMAKAKAAVMAGAQQILREAHQFGSPHLTATQRMLLR